ncbi:plakophilin-1 [Anableps anableps]
MMVPDPVRSAMDVGSAEDTSLAMPSDRNLSSGQQRVLNQVHSIKRSKSKYKNDSSPTSPEPQTSKSYNDFKFRGASTYSRATSTFSDGFNKGKSRSLISKSLRGRNVSSSIEQQFSTSSRPKSPKELKTSRSDPALTSVSRFASGHSMKVKGQAPQNQFQVSRGSSSMINGTESQSHFVRVPSAHSQTDGRSGTIKLSKMVKSTGHMSDITLKEAVDYLSNANDDYKQCGASFIQHVSFSDESAKDEVFELNGIPPLVNMLESRNAQLVQAASGALRNLVHKNFTNKMEVEKCGGIAKALNQLNNTKTTETKKQLAGLLWNLSSADQLKPELMTTALPALTKNVVVPFTSDSEESDQCVDPTVFHYATGCLRNLSSSSDMDRQKMRESNKLVDSLMKYIFSCLAEDIPDDQSVENCMCTLHNLTYQLWKECPDIEPPLSSSSSTEAIMTQSEGRKSPTVGCFSPRSKNVQNGVNHPLKEWKEETKRSGLGCLYSLKAIDAYISLLVSAKKEGTLEASCGALQNLTASKEKGSTTMSEILYPKLYSAMVFPALFWSSHTAVQKTAISLMDNMSRKVSLHSMMAKQTLPELVSLLSSEKWISDAPPENIEAICTIIYRLLLVDQEFSKKTINKELILTLIKLNERIPEDSASTAAGKLLYSLWTDKFLRSITKKLKFHKSNFVNSRTIKSNREEEQ